MKNKIMLFSWTAYHVRQLYFVLQLTLSLWSRSVYTKSKAGLNLMTGSKTPQQSTIKVYLTLSDRLKI